MFRAAYSRIRLWLDLAEFVLGMASVVVAVVGVSVTCFFLVVAGLFDVARQPHPGWVHAAVAACLVVMVVTFQIGQVVALAAERALRDVAGEPDGGGAVQAITLLADAFAKGRAGGLPVQVRMGMSLPPMPAWFAAVMFLWFAVNFAVGYVLAFLVGVKVIPTELSDPAAFVALYVYNASVAVYLVLAVGCVTARAEVHRAVWRWRFVASLALTAAAWALAAFGVVPW